MNNPLAVYIGYRNTKQIIRAYGIILACVVLGFVVRLSKWNEFGLPAHIATTVLSFFLAAALWEALRIINIQLDRRLPFEKGIGIRILVQIFIGTVVGLSARLVIYFFGEPNLPFKLDSLFIAATWVIYAIVPAGINLGFFTHYFLHRWRDSLVLAERLEKEKSQVQFDNLKNQLNPHFLFNALTSLNSLIFEDQQLASQFLKQLSKVYRYVLQNEHRQHVPLHHELDFIQHYVSLLETRFRDALRITFAIAKEHEERAIVPVTLQILIENALKHNIVDKDKPLQITISTTDDYLTVENNLQTRKLMETSNKLGLGNLKSLYHFLSDKPVIISQTSDSFVVKVPLL